MAKVQASVAAGGLSGSSGPCVFVRRRDGSVVLRERVDPRDPRTAAQLAAREAMRRASAAFAALDPAQMQAWLDYARLQAEADWAQGGRAQPNALNAYRRLALKALQVDPLAALPTLPPSAPFGGDAVTFAVGATGVGVVFTASGPDAPGVVTELLVQPLRLAVSPVDPAKYRSRGFVAFASAGEEALAPVRAGWVAPAVRFVRAATGQVSPLLAFAPVRVG
ncbi:MAG: hypothetical protein KF857_11065 [Fimbriimonadaceae bacterium]|nr:hypothetical protein [Fimbriimonadaceae bacterium]